LTPTSASSHGNIELAREKNAAAECFTGAAAAAAAAAVQIQVRSTDHKSLEFST